jgi:hypothetical protein
MPTQSPVLGTASRGPTFDYMVNEKSQTTQEHVLSASTILSNAGFSPTDYYLVELRGDSQVSYKDQSSAQVHMHEHAAFLAIFMGSTPVS